MGDEWTLYKHLPTLFKTKTVSVKEFNEKLGSQLHMKKGDSFKVIKELKEQGIVEHSVGRGRLLFRW